MSFNQVIQPAGRISLKVTTFLVGVVLLASCALPNPIAQGSPIASLVPGSTSTIPISTLDTPQSSRLDLTSTPTPITTLTPAVSTPADGFIPTDIEYAATQYDLDAVFDFNQHILTVTETITYVNSTTEALIDMILVVESNHRPGVFELDSLTLGTGELINDYDLEGHQLNIPLTQPLDPGDGLSILIRYALNIPEIAPPSNITRPLPFGYSERQTNIVDWYPYIPPYQVGEGWQVHENWWFGEHQVFDMAKFNVRLTLTEPVEDLVLAASAPAEQDGVTYRYHLEAARSFALSASNIYLVQTTQVGEVTIYSYSFPFDEYAGKEVLQNTADALELYSQLIIPYPHSSLSVVEADFLDGMEYDGLYFLSHGFYNLYDGTPKGYLTFIAAHETAHQWWYGLVGNDQALEPWLDEAMCTYMEKIFYENVYAEYPTNSDSSMVDWWWYYRVNFYDPKGWIDGEIYDYAQFRPYRDAVYLNGAKFLDDLRSLIGDRAFFSFLRDYASQNRNRIATKADFFSILQDNTSKDLDGLITEYFLTDK